MDKPPVFAGRWCHNSN